MYFGYIGVRVHSLVARFGYHLQRRRASVCCQSSTREQVSTGPRALALAYHLVSQAQILHFAYTYCSTILFKPFACPIVPRVCVCYGPNFYVFSPSSPVSKKVDKYFPRRLIAGSIKPVQLLRTSGSDQLGQFDASPFSCSISRPKELSHTC